MQYAEYRFSPEQQRQALLWLVVFHVAVIVASNYLVQFPFSLTLPGGTEVHTTWGAFSFPFIFLATDLTVRIFGRALARKIIFCVMLPALAVSYAVSVLFSEGAWNGAAALATFNLFVFRIALASFAAYAFGQLLDIFVFNKLRRLNSWWIAPSASTVMGNALDTLLFFSIAFYASSDAYMAQHWPQIAWVDYLTKLVVCLGFFLPAYGVLLAYLTKKLTTLSEQQAAAQVQV